MREIHKRLLDPTNVQYKTIATHPYVQVVTQRLKNKTQNYGLNTKTTIGIPMKHNLSKHTSDDWVIPTWHFFFQYNALY